ncbi:MAG: hypothetical protein ACOCRK_11825 [bacterium]
MPELFNEEMFQSMLLIKQLEQSEKINTESQTLTLKDFIDKEIIESYYETRRYDEYTPNEFINYAKEKIINEFSLEGQLRKLIKDCYYSYMSQYPPYSFIKDLMDIIMFNYEKKSWLETNIVKTEMFTYIGEFIKKAY